MAFGNKEYFEKIGVLQQNIHKSEKRRFQLEKELLAFCTSGKQGSEIKNAKLRCYLKQISEREKRAKARNLELLRRVESLELHMNALCFNCSALQQKKVLQGSADSNRSPYHAEDLHQAAAIFVGPQTSRPLPVEAEATRLSSGQPSSAAHDRFSCPLKHSESGTFTNPRLTKKGACGPADRPDDASAVGELPAYRRDAGTAARTDVGLERLSLSLNSEASEEEAPPAVGIRRGGAGTPPAKCILGGLSKDGAATGDNESASRVSSPEFVPGGKQQDALDGESHSLPSPGSEKSVDLALSLGSDRSPSLCEGDDPVGFQEGSAQPSARSQKTDGPGGGTERSDQPRLASVHHADAQGQSEATEESEDGRRSRCEETQSTMEAAAPILCNGKAGLNEEDLEACGAVALHQLQRLSWSMPNGCLLPHEIVSANWTAGAEESRIRSGMSAYGAKLWERWFRHATELRDRRVYTADGIAKLFAPLLVEKGAVYTDKAEALLSVLLQEDRVDSDESSGALPSLLFDGGEIKAARNARCHEAFAHGQQSGEEDSQEESSVESIPIRETKAYLLLKQSATQHRPESPPEDEDELGAFPSGVTRDGHAEDAGKDEAMRATSFSERPLVGAGKVTKSTVPAVQTKAFWGESDDSDSDIEAALRPQSRGMAVDDFDYSYD